MDSFNSDGRVKEKGDKFELEAGGLDHSAIYKAVARVPPPKPRGNRFEERTDCDYADDRVKSVTRIPGGLEAYDVEINPNWFELLLEVKRT